MTILAYGSQGPAVSLLQAALNRGRYGALTVDGIFGRATERAVKAFQERNSLAATGIVNEKTQSRLMPLITGYDTYTIHSGDTFYLVAQKYGTTAERITVANPSLDPANLIPGTKIIVPLSTNVVFTNIPFTSEALAYAVDGLTKRYPFIKSEVIGTSVLGTPITALTIGSGERKVSFNASHHANEWITTPVLMKFLEEYAAAFSEDRHICCRSAAELFESATLYVVPMVNPDGVDLVTGLIEKGSDAYNAALAMNGGGRRFPEDWKANINGVDLNLQYPAGWEQAREIKFSQGYTQPGPRDYVGNAPLDQPESYAMAEYTIREDFDITLSYHTQGEIIYWHYLDYLPEDSYRIALALSNISGYALETTPYNSGFAGYKDWFIYKFDRPGYTIEAGLGTNPLPISQFDNIYGDNRCMLTLALYI